jgi:hypothetical protein
LSRRRRASLCFTYYIETYRELIVNRFLPGKSVIPSRLGLKAADDNPRPRANPFRTIFYKMLDGDGNVIEFATNDQFPNCRRRDCVRHGSLAILRWERFVATTVSRSRRSRIFSPNCSILRSERSETSLRRLGICAKASARKVSLWVCCSATWDKSSKAKDERETRGR